MIRFFNSKDSSAFLRRPYFSKSTGLKQNGNRLCKSYNDSEDDLTLAQVVRRRFRYEE